MRNAYQGLIGQRGWSQPITTRVQNCGKGSMRHVGCEMNPPNETLDSQLTFLNAETGLHYEEDVPSRAQAIVMVHVVLEIDL